MARGTRCVARVFARTRRFVRCPTFNSQQFPLRRESADGRKAPEAAARTDDAVAGNDDRHGVGRHHPTHRSGGLRRANCGSQLRVGARLAEGDPSACGEDFALERRPLAVVDSHVREIDAYAGRKFGQSGDKSVMPALVLGSLGSQLASVRGDRRFGCRHRFMAERNSLEDLIVTQNGHPAEVCSKNCQPAVA